MYARVTPLFSLLFLSPPAADGWLGVYLQQDRNEAAVAEVIPGSPAAKAGLQAGDVLLAVGDQATASAEEFIAAIRKSAAGDRVRIKIRRKNQESIVLVKLGDRPETVAAAPQVPTEAVLGHPAGPATETAVPAAPGQGYLGISVLETEAGVRIERVLADSPARQAGLAEGEVLVTVGEQPVRSLGDLDRLIGKAKPGQKVALGLRGESGVRSVLVEIGAVPGTKQASKHVSAAPLAPAHAPQPAVKVAGPKPHPAANPAPEAHPAPLARPRTTAVPAPASEAAPVDIERELEALRGELRELRKQVEELRKGGGRE
jgi:S1-C subfamily serine protease